VSDPAPPHDWFVYRVRYGQTAATMRSELVDFERPVALGDQIRIAGAWWKVDRVSRPQTGNYHRGEIEASPMAELTAI
jgi:hypothetical protein